jgi:hypothetical protein
MTYRYRAAPAYETTTSSDRSDRHPAVGTASEKLTTLPRWESHGRLHGSLAVAGGSLIEEHRAVLFVAMEDAYASPCALL